MHPDSSVFGETDLVLRRRVLQSLHVHDPDNAAHLDISVVDGTVTLTGTVVSPEARRVCREICRHIPGVYQLIDQMHLAAQDETGSASGTPPKPK